MILRITERNAWERETWSYYITIEQQSPKVLNELMIFIRVANKYFDEVKESAPEPERLSIFDRHQSKLFAASRYTFDFVEVSYAQKFGGGNYKTGGDYTDSEISIARIHSAVVALRDRKGNKRTNLLYKNFESLFLKKKQHSKQIA